MITIKTDDPHLFMEWFDMSLDRFGCVTKFDLYDMWGVHQYEIGDEQYTLDSKLGWRNTDCIKDIKTRKYMSGGFVFEIQLTEPEEL